MKIVVLDGYTLNPGDNPWDELQSLGDVTVYDRTPHDQIIARSAGAEIVLTNKTPLDADILASLPKLRFIGVLATGYNVVDIPAAVAQNIVVTNVPEYGTDSVAQHVFSLVLELSNAVGEHNAAVHDGEWQRCPDFSFWHSPPIELAGKSLGIVGFGRIGQRVAEIGKAFGMQILSNTRTNGTPIEELRSNADIVSLHCPLTEQTRSIIDPDFLKSMKPTSFLINTARGPLVDEAALADALDKRTIAGAAVDVVDSEPIRPDNPLLRARNCIITPHLAWASVAARRRLMTIAVDNVRAFLDGRPINTVG